MKFLESGKSLHATVTVKRTSNFLSIKVSLGTTANEKKEPENIKQIEIKNIL